VNYGRLSGGWLLFRFKGLLLAVGEDGAARYDVPQGGGPAAGQCLRCCVSVADEPLLFKPRA